MGELQLLTARLELRPLPPIAARVLGEDRVSAAKLIRANLHPQWPQPELLGVLSTQELLTPETARFGVWLVIERVSRTVVGDAGFLGPPADDGTVEIGYGIVPDRRRRHYASEAAGALVEWALGQPEVLGVEARCDPANVASVRILERIGFSRVGRADGQLRWRR